MSLPSTMKAIKVVAPGKAELQSVPLPKLRDDYVLVKVACVAINPTDWKHVDLEMLAKAGIGHTVGCDFSGTIVQVGSKVLSSWAPGDRVAGFAHGVNSAESEDGCFAEYCVLKDGVGMKVPASMTDEEASTLGVGVTTVGQGLYQSLGLPLPVAGKKADPTGEQILVYGASTATGSLAVQFASHSGYEVLGISSEHNFPMVRSLGAAAMFDYHVPSCGESIRAHTHDQLRKVFDCISEGTSPQICCDAISSHGGAISTLLPVELPRHDVENKHTLGYTVTGESFVFAGNEVPAKYEDWEFGRKFWNVATQLLASGEIRVHPPQVREGGLQGVFGGMQHMKDGKVSGVKLVYRVAETS